jgi:hypothetical protein
VRVLLDVSRFGDGYREPDRAETRERHDAVMVAAHERAL